jgi:hypothetical protein
MLAKTPREKPTWYRYSSPSTKSHPQVLGSFTRPMSVRNHLIIGTNMRYERRLLVDYSTMKISSYDPVFPLIPCSYPQKPKRRLVTRFPSQFALVDANINNSVPLHQPDTTTNIEYLFNDKFLFPFSNIIDSSHETNPSSLPSSTSR